MSHKELCGGTANSWLSTLDTAAELMVLKQLYATLCLYTNVFQQTMKLKKQRAFWQLREEELPRAFAAFVYTRVIYRPSSSLPA
jgi:hypothetical protein